MFSAPNRIGRIKAIVIGVSTGGPSALMKVLGELPSDFKLPILVAQHMPSTFTKSLAKDLDAVSPLDVVEASNGDLVQAGKVFIAPGGRQMKLEPTLPYPTIQITDDAVDNHCSPSVDYLLDSAAMVYGGGTFVAILTGMGDDGVAGCEKVVQRGGVVITQDRESSVVYGMPKRVFEAGLSNKTCSIDEIAIEFIHASNGKPL